ncbi:hypothetical protein RB594_003384 [Gaeumannomyces avenae]
MLGKLLAGILNAANTIGIFSSAFAAGVISGLVGRRRTIAVACVVCAAGVVAQYFGTSIPMLFGGKLISPVGFGVGHSLGPVFVAELAPVKMRGLCLVLVNTMIVLGQWLSSLVAYIRSAAYDGDEAWRIPIITQIIPPGVMLIALIWLPESPSWLLIKGQREDARRAFLVFNGPSFDADAAMAVADAAIALEAEAREAGRASGWADCFRGTNRRRTTIIVMVYLAQQLIGVNFFGDYLTYYFRLAGVQDPLAVGQAATAIQLVGKICSWPLVDRLGRRPLIVGGSFVMTALLLIVGGVSTIPTPGALAATVAFMVIWGFL